jgi:hypothetical protein
MLRRNITKYKNTNKLFKLATKNMQGFFFTVQPNTEEITKSKDNKNPKGIPVYEAPEWSNMSSYLSKNNYFSLVPKSQKAIELQYEIWQDYVMSSEFKAKYFALLPFQAEDRLSFNAKKKFVVNMELFPESKHLKFTFAMLSGNKK